MNKILFFLLFPILIFSQEIDSFYELVSYDIYKNKISTKDALVFDVRTTEEFNLGHIKGSINIDFYDEKLFVDFFQKINKTKPIYIYCRSRFFRVGRAICQRCFGKNKMRLAL